MSVKSMLGIELVCHCQQSTLGEGNSETIIHGGASSLPRCIQRGSFDKRKKISISKHISNSHRKRDRFPIKVSQPASQIKGGDPPSVTHHWQIATQINDSENRPHALNHGNFQHSKPKLILVRRQPPPVPKHQIHIPTYQPFIDQHKHQQHLSKSPPPSVVPGISSTTNRHGATKHSSYTVYSNNNIRWEAPIQPNIQVVRVSTCETLNTSHKPLDKSDNNHLSSTINSPRHSNRLKQNRQMEQFRQVESQYAESLENSLGSLTSEVDRDFIYQLQKYQPKLTSLKLDEQFQPSTRKRTQVSSLHWSEQEF